ncbi:MAG: cation diffusion facilitator family transporter [Bryobacteraceae bacterium]|nr:cation diffusion facilitator family transporter [Bryobacteraceae bacterium]MCX7605379.1 cation diffusion facilitator family transporter [Bryobacteraceae bacterium]
MRLSLAFGVLMLIGKAAAWHLTNSSSIFSDAIESVVHVAAVGFAAFALRLSRRPAGGRYHYGLERVAFFSAGFEGALIAAAAVSILVTSIYQWRQGLPLQRLTLGAGITLALGLANGALGWHLIRTGRRHHSLILEANGRHVLTDCITSVAAFAGVGLVILTGWKPFDPIVAILVALQILYSGAQLVWRSAQGLLDYADPEVERALRDALDGLARQHGIEYHGLRLRATGGRFLAEAHLIFPYATSLGAAHHTATLIEEALARSFAHPLEVTTHLEAAEDHDERHAAGHGR